MENDKELNESLPGLPSALDVSPEDLDKLGKLPLRAQQIGALLACGFTCAEIDKAFNLADKTAGKYKSYYFSRNSVDISPRTRDAIIAAFLRHKSIQLVSGITPDKVTKAGAAELAKSATMLMTKAQSLEGTATHQDIGAQISDALSKLSQRVDSKQLA